MQVIQHAHLALCMYVSLYISISLSIYIRRYGHRARSSGAVMYACLPPCYLGMHASTNPSLHAVTHTDREADRQTHTYIKYTNIHVMCPQVLQLAHRSDATPADVKHRHQPPSAPSSSPPPPTPCPRCSSPAGSMYTHTSISWMPGVGGAAAAEDVAEQARKHGAIGALLSPCEGAVSPPLGAVAGGALSQTGMHACMHACIHTHTHTHTYTYIQTYIHRVRLQVVLCRRRAGGR